MAADRERLAALLSQAGPLGVTVMTGSDVVGSVAREVVLLTELGVPPVAALAAATTAARAYLGLPSLSAGAPADVVTYHHDPREDPGVLSRPAAVLRGGHRIR